MSDFSREARAYCRQHNVYFYPNDAGCEQCERDYEYEDEKGDAEIKEIMQNCICDIPEGKDICDLIIICGNYTAKTDKTCFYCGHMEDCHDIGG